MVYRRKKDSDTWHFCTNCSNWPASDYVEQTKPGSERPSGGELCDECKGKDGASNCNKKY